jgi:hypothetical protein
MGICVRLGTDERRAHQHRPDGVDTAHTNEVPVADYGYRITERDWTTAVLLGAESLWFGLETLATRMDAPAVTPRATGLFNAIVAKVRTFK